MPTNEERREVAARLRDYIFRAQNCDRYNFGDDKKLLNGNEMFRSVAQAVGGGCANMTDTYEETLTKLIALIDPTPDYTQTQVTNCCPCGARATCRMEHNKEKGGVFCSNCGEEMDAYTCEWEDGYPVEYSYPFCYQCGAMVVRK